MTDAFYHPRKIKWKFITLFLLVPVFPFAQNVSEKEINQQYQFWTSINSTTRFDEKWGMLADFHIRTNNFMAEPSFYFLRGAANY